MSPLRSGEDPILRAACRADRAERLAHDARQMEAWLAEGRPRRRLYSEAAEIHERAAAFQEAAVGRLLLRRERHERDLACRRTVTPV